MGIRDELDDLRSEHETLKAYRDELIELLERIGNWLQNNADYDMTDTGAYVPSNTEARLLSDIEMTLRCG